jgi:hypothetical protein
MICSEVVGAETVSSSGPMPMLMDKKDGCLEWEDGGTIFGWGVRKAWMDGVCHRAVVVMPRKIVDDSIIGGFVRLMLQLIGFRCVDFADASSNKKTSCFGS